MNEIAKQKVIIMKKMIGVCEEVMKEIRKNKMVTKQKGERVNARLSYEKTSPKVTFLPVVLALMISTTTFPFVFDFVSEGF